MQRRYSIYLAVLIGCFTFSVNAETYVGFGIGSAAYKADLTSLGGGELDDSGLGTKLYGGYAFNQYFAAEVAAYNFAEASIGAIEIAPGSVVSAAVSMKGAAAYGVVMYPLSKQTTLMAKLGVLRWDADLRVNNTSGANDGTDLAYAIAASYGLTKDFLITAEWESFNTDNPELSMFSVGFRFNFR